MTYYHDLITEKSWQLLQELKRKYHFILIGGWAVYLYTHALKSRDIDIIVDFQELEKLKAYYELPKNERLKKYEIHQGEFDIDIYIPYYSDLGIPIEEIQKRTRTISGFIAPEPEILLILKQKAFENRSQSLKGRKDTIDIFALLKNGVDFIKYQKLLEEFDLKEYKNSLKELIEKTREVPELNINPHQLAQVKKEWRNHLE